ncbi:hypothetical protein CWI38_1615p0010, partial [Hamiltosporidium tvaerminnensis]
MGRRNKVDSENIKNEKIKAVNNLKNSAGEILMCDVDVAMLSEGLPPQPTFHNTTHQPPSSSCQTSPVCLVDTIPSSSGTDATACEPANGMKNLNTGAILEGNRLMVLHSILDSVTARMPRNGWPATLAEREIRQEENGERRRIATYEFLSKIKEISMKEIGKVVVRTRKNPNKLVDSKVLDLINRVVGEYAGAHVPESITEAAYIMQAAQVCYDEATRKEKPRSAWKENIESKISKLVLSKDLLDKTRKQEKLSTSETKSLNKITREFNLNLSSVTDLSVALVKKNESLNVYEKKNSKHESKSNSEKRIICFSSSERVESEHVVSRDEIVSFWSTMWNKNDDTVTYDDYLIPFVSDNHPTTFPSLDEFVNIINWLPNWKAAGIDGIYDFFIKKLTTLHKYIYDIVKVICLEGTTQADWFYCGLTYLISKGILQRGSDYRPITCMSNLYKLT